LAHNRLAGSSNPSSPTTQFDALCPGDYVLARRGLKNLAGVGKVTQSAFYSPGNNPHCDHPNFLGVEWQDAPRDKAFPSIVFLRPTLTEISEEEFRKLVEAQEITVDRPEAVEGVQDQQAFALEKYLEDFIVTNFDRIFRGDLRIHEDSEGNGQQYLTEIGRIDILAFEPRSRSFVVIELKKGRPSDQVIGQTLRYMGWVKKNLCNDGQGVKGLIVCRDSDAQLSYALEMTNDIDVRYYKVSFQLADVPPE